MNITSVKEYIRNTSLALLHAFTIFLLAYGLPLTYEMISSDKHMVIDQIGKIRFIGPILLLWQIKAPTMLHKQSLDV